MTHEMIFAGFGGQGIMVMGQLMAYAGMLENRHVSWIPSYGPEMRGGTANCSIIISDEEIGSPIVTEPTLVVAMNLPSLEKFEPLLIPEGKLIVNRSLIDINPARQDILGYSVSANELATELGNAKVMNMIMLGAIVACSQAVQAESVFKAFSKIFASKPHLLDLNHLALEKGYKSLIPL